jgi:subtilisin-like proprotein convertase family protein
VTLVSPSGSKVALHEYAGNTTDGLIQTYDSSQFSNLRPLEGHSGQGTWTLKVADTVGQDVGTLLRWSLELAYGG